MMHLTNLSCGALACIALTLLLAAPTIANADGTPLQTQASSAPVTDSYYELLGVDVKADDKSIKKAYRKQALIHHPDKAVDEADKQLKNTKFQRLANAYEVLTNRILRIRYDWLLKQGVFEYDEQRDWDRIDPTIGIMRTVKRNAEQEFRFRSAYEAYEKAQAEADEFALKSAFIIAAICAICPALWFWWKRRQAEIIRKQEQKKKAQALKADQTLLLELQKEREFQLKQQQAEQREYARQLQMERAELAAEEEQSNSEASDSEQHSGESGDEAENNSDHSEHRKKPKKINAAGGGKCELCRKIFKSDAQLQQHYNSNQHKNAEKAAAKRK